MLKNKALFVVILFLLMPVAYYFVFSSFIFISHDIGYGGGKIIHFIIFLVSFIVIVMSNIMIIKRISSK